MKWQTVVGLVLTAACAVALIWAVTKSGPAGSSPAREWCRQLGQAGAELQKADKAIQDGELEEATRRLRWAQRTVRAVRVEINREAVVVGRPFAEEDGS
jgi:hypothetical protein